MKDYATKYLGRKVLVKVDRPLGSKHPKYSFVYSVNYGFVPDTEAPDGEELDAYILGVDRPLSEFEGTCIAVIHRTDDEDDKLVVCPEGKVLKDSEIRQATDFQEKWFTSEIIRSAK